MLIVFPWFTKYLRSSLANRSEFLWPFLKVQRILGPPPRALFRVQLDFHFEHSREPASLCLLSLFPYEGVTSTGRGFHLCSLVSPSAQDMSDA